MTVQLPDGVALRQLRTHADYRGAFTEIFRFEWDTGVRPIQWNAVESAARTLRGVHVHPRHDDYLILLRGLPASVCGISAAVHPPRVGRAWSNFRVSACTPSRSPTG